MGILTRMQPAQGGRRPDTGDSAVDAAAWELRQRGCRVRFNQTFHGTTYMEVDGVLCTREELLRLASGGAGPEENFRLANLSDQRRQGIKENA